MTAAAGVRPPTDLRASTRPALGGVGDRGARRARVVSRRTGALLCGLAATLLGACSDGPPGTVLDGPRVMALIASSNNLARI